MIWSIQAGSDFAPAMDAGSRMFSSAVSVGSRLNCWKMKPILSRRSFVRPCPPGRRARVADGDRAAVSGVETGQQCMSVDLPEPEGP